jgi:hypothetical protein
MHGVAPARVGALKGRLQHFQRLGFPAGVNTGRGKPAEYGVSAILRIVVAFELLQLGLMPERAVGIMRLLGSVMVHAAGHAAGPLLESGAEEFVQADGNILLFFDPSALGGLTGVHTDDLEGVVNNIARSIYTRNSSDLDDPYDFEWSRRQCVVNITHLIIETAHRLETNGVPKADFGKALLDWAETFEWRK